MIYNLLQTKAAPSKSPANNILKPLKTLNLSNNSSINHNPNKNANVSTCPLSLFPLSKTSVLPNPIEQPSGWFPSAKSKTLPTVYQSTILHLNCKSMFHVLLSALHLLWAPLVQIHQKLQNGIKLFQKSNLTMMLIAINKTLTIVLKEMSNTTITKIILLKMMTKFQIVGICS